MVKGDKVRMIEVPGKMFPHVVEPYREDGVVVVTNNMQMEYVWYDF